MSLTYQYFLERSGLSERDAAALHQVSIAQVRMWTTLRTRVPASAINALYKLCRAANATRPPDKFNQTLTPQ